MTFALIQINSNVMKKHILFTVVFIMSVTFSKAEKSAKFIIENFNEKHEIFVLIDDQVYESSNAQIVVSDLCAGVHEVKIFSKPDYRLCGLQPKAIYINNMVFSPNEVKLLKLNEYGNVEVSSSVKNTPNSSSNFHSNYYPTVNSMSNENFEKLLNSIRNEYFDTVKLKTAKRAIKSNSVTSNQVSQLVSELNFESNKLEFAKYAYKRTVDPQNYFLVSSNFTFSSSKDTLFDYIAGY